MTSSDQRTDRVLPPGQRLAEELPVLHYGPVPRFRAESWDLRVTGATLDGRTHRLGHDEVLALPRARVTADLHCVTRFSVLDQAWEGVLTRTLLDLAPPSPEVTDVMVWAEYGYSANLSLDDLYSPRVLLATHLDGRPLTPEHGFPLRLVVPHRYAWKGPKWVRGIEYLTAPARGFWEERGYHAVGDPWREERYSYQE